MKYCKHHTWINKDSEIGITKYAADELGEILYIDTIVAPGQHIKEGDTIAFIESTKACAEVKSPAQGKVINIRDYIVHIPTDMNESPESYPLIVLKEDKIRTTLMTEEEYKNFCKE